MGGSKSTVGGIRVDRLSDLQCKAAKPDDTIRKLTDGRGMYLAVMPNGSKLWRLKYRHGGKERIYSIGAFPEIGVAAARAERDRARGILKEGKDPTIDRRVARTAAAAVDGVTFRIVAEEWLERQRFSAGHLEATRVRLDQDLLPHLGDLPVREITPAIALETLRRIERRGALETAAKCRRLASQVFRFAIQTARADVDPVAPLRGALRTSDTRNRATIPLDEMPDLLKAIAAVPSELTTRACFLFTLLTCARTVEARFATWAEIRGNRWYCPAERMKSRREHVVPLSTQTLAVIERARELRTEPEPSALLFPGFTRSGSLSENALLALLARAGYFGRQTTHGFRASFSTWAHEALEADPDHIEACLAHVVPGVRGDYNRASYLKQRAPILQAWADQLTEWGMVIP
ncbi:MAG: integrase arm-type DNA-binding domain-containing protein [Casimicrobiaceae bacterium]